MKSLVGALGKSTPAVAWKEKQAITEPVANHISCGSQDEQSFDEF